LLGFGLPVFLGRGATAASATFIRIGTDGYVTLTVPQVEMGQADRTDELQRLPSRPDHRGAAHAVLSTDETVDAMR
jgi:hypothetical protein